MKTETVSYTVKMTKKEWNESLLKTPASVRAFVKIAKNKKEWRNLILGEEAEK